MQSSTVPKVIRWRLRLLEFDFITLHVPGEENLIADTLSRAFFHRAAEVNTITDDEKMSRIISIHNDIVGHHGVNKSVEILKASNLIWAGAKSDVAHFISECLPCQKFKYSRDKSPSEMGHHIHGCTDALRQTFKYPLSPKYPLSVK